MFAQLEGMPGSGKTTAARTVATCCGFVIAKELDHVSHPGFDPMELSECSKWYIGSEIARQQQLTEVLETGRSIIQDRGLLSTLAFTYASLAMLDRGHEYDSYLDTVAVSVAGQVLLPNLLMFLSVSAHCSVARRANCDPRYVLWFDSRFLDFYEEFYSVVSGHITACPTMTIDTSSTSIRDVSMIIIEALRDEAQLRSSIRAGFPS